MCRNTVAASKPISVDDTEDEHPADKSDLRKSPREAEDLLFHVLNSSK